MKEIYFITGNKGKILEATQKFSNVNIKIIQKNIGYPEIQTDSLKNVAEFGIEDIRKRFDKPFITEDAGLFIDSLNGFPGVFSAYVFQTIACEGILKLLKNIEEDHRTAVFKSVYAYFEPGKKPLFFTGECPGSISDKIIGGNGFGYDPIFIPNKSEKTFAQMKTDEKNKYSHRGKSLDKLICFFET